jgi:hypothetical protein
MHLVVNWQSERGEYSKAAGFISLQQKTPGFSLFSNFYFLSSDFNFLSLQFNDSDRLSTVFFGLKRVFLNQRM